MMADVKRETIHVMIFLSRFKILIFEFSVFSRQTDSSKTNMQKIEL